MLIAWFMMSAINYYQVNEERDDKQEKEKEWETIMKDRSVDFYVRYVCLEEFKIIRIVDFHLQSTGKRQTAH